MPIGTTIADVEWVKSLHDFQFDPDHMEDPLRQNAWVFACLNSWVRNMTSVPFVLYDTSGEDGNQKIVEEDEVTKLLNKPNPLMDGVQLWAMTVLNLGLHGKAYWIKESGRSRRTRPTELPKHLYPAPAPNMKARVDDKGRLVRWDYHVGGKVIKYQPHEVVFFQFPDSADPLRGLAPMHAAMRGANIDYLGLQFNEAFFKNGADLGGTLQTEQKLTRDQARAQLELFEDRHAGSRKAKRVALLSHGVKYEQIRASHREMEYLAGLRWTRDIVLACFGVPKVEVASYEDVNFAVADAALKHYWKQVLQPIMRMLARSVTMTLLMTPGLDEPTPLAGYEDRKLDWDYSNVLPLQEAVADKLANAKTMRDMGLPLDVINEELSMGWDLTTVMGSDFAFVPTTLMPITTDNPKDLIPDPGPANSGPNQGDPPPTPGGTGPGGNQPRKPKKPPKRPPPKKEVETYIDEEKMVSHAVRRRKLRREVYPQQERLWRGKVRKYFFDVRKSVLRNFDEAVARHEDEETTPVAASALINVERSHELLALIEEHGIEAIVREPELTEQDMLNIQVGRARWDAELARRVAPLYAATAEATMPILEAELGGFNSLLGARDPRILSFIGDRIPVLARDVNGTLAKQVQSQLLAGLARNETVGDIRERLTTTFNQASSRATTVARTEVGIGVNGSRYVGMKAEGVESIVWITAQDSLVRDSHTAQSGMVVPIDTAFPNGLLYPLDPNGAASEIINCRCDFGAA